MKKVSLPPNFTTVYITIVIFTILSIMGMFFLSIQGNLSITQTQLFELLSTFAKMGFGAIIGLISAKNTFLP